jgi:hypothetical protein
MGFKIAQLGFKVLITSLSRVLLCGALGREKGTIEAMHDNHCSDFPPTIFFLVADLSTEMRQRFKEKLINIECGDGRRLTVEVGREHKPFLVSPDVVLCTSFGLLSSTFICIIRLFFLLSFFLSFFLERFFCTQLPLSSSSSFFFSFHQLFSERTSLSLLLYTSERLTSHLRPSPSLYRLGDIICYNITKNLARCR